jgi:hypothetical protein
VSVTGSALAAVWSAIMVIAAATVNNILRIISSCSFYGSSWGCLRFNLASAKLVKAE